MIENMGTISRFFRLGMDLEAFIMLSVKIRELVPK